MLACLLDHADGELARLTGQTSSFGHYYDLITDALVMTALFIGIGVGLSADGLRPAALRLGLIAAGAVALAVLLRLELERRAGKAATRQPNLLGFEAQDLLYLVGPAAWLDGLETFLMLAAIGAPVGIRPGRALEPGPASLARRQRAVTVLVTGATGFVGLAVVRTLLARGEAVRILVRRPGDRGQVAGLPVEAVVGDLRDPASLAPAVVGCTALFHVAADYRLVARDPAALYRTNVEGTRNILRRGARGRRRARRLHQQRRDDRHPRRRHARRRAHAGHARRHDRPLQAFEIPRRGRREAVRARRPAGRGRQPVDADRTAAT